MSDDTFREPRFLARPAITGSFGVSASTHWIASSVAQSVLERGGNAFDAATAAAFVLHVVEPHLNGPGGDLVALIAPAGQSVEVLCGQGPAPAAATIDHFRSEGLAAVPGAGALAAAVPGAVEAWLLLLRDHGGWELEDVLSYAIHYAEAGHPILASTCAVIGQVRDLFTTHWPTSARLWLRDGAAPSPGDIVTSPAYARTLRLLLAESAGAPDRSARIDAARRAWGQGFVAEAIGRFVAGVPHRHATGGDHRGLLTAADMAAYSAHYEPALSAEFRGRRVHKARPWTQGPVLLQALSILDGFGDDELDLDTAAGIHRVVEALKLAMADRDAYYGDGHDPEALAVLMSADYAKQRRDLIGPRSSWELRPGSFAGLPRPYRPVVAASAGTATASVGEPTVRVTGETRGDTCHIDVIDRWGNAISATPSGGWLQSSPAVPELGFCLGTRLQMTHLDPASPSALAPGRRPRTTLTPTMVTTEDSITALGSPGGDQQEQWQLVYLVRTLAGGFGSQQAIEAPMFHTTGFPGSFWPRSWEPGGLVIEDRVGQAVLTDLQAMGHAVRRAGDWALGRLSSVHLDRTEGRIVGAANPRGAQGYAVGR
ncbi:gamma-glutamyltransferase [Actinomadura sp. 7K507]|uniref:gamma-glutamyltransferase family protein n=1 Tax=Actinomadura sp. 7K507 TaxID=2530365 RepID=UPI001042CA95|nr:gamma-glutamyltransferase [Actinomadura sp. 7K507]TDC76231.1 transferase [Actinomadura sp. 7K507]